MMRYFVGMTKSRVGRHLIMCCMPHSMKDWPSSVLMWLSHSYSNHYFFFLFNSKFIKIVNPSIYFVVPLFLARVFQTKVNVLYTQRAKSHLPRMHGKETRAYGENYKSLSLARDALIVKGIYFNKGYVSENENLRYVI